MISIQPQWVEKILNGEKTIEIRKTMPKCKLPIDVYIYCTKQGGYLTKERVKECYFDDNGHIEYMVTPKRNPFYRNSNLDIEMEEDVKQRSLNSKVVAKFTLNKVDKIGLADHWCNYGIWLLNEEKCLSEEEKEQILKDSCLYFDEITDYLGYGDIEYYEFANGYVWYIDNLEIFDMPKGLKDFNMNKASQSWCYCEVNIHEE